MTASMQFRLRQALQLGYAATMVPAYRRFFSSANNVLQAQEQLLVRTLKANENSRYGRAFGFDAINSIEEFQNKVPIVDFEDLRPWVDDIAKGEKQVLTSEPVLMLERTSGSTGKNKLIPYTQGLLDQFSEATYAWQLDLMLHHPALIGTKSYWSISPSFDGEKTTTGGVPIGFEDDTEYFNPVMRWALNESMAVPASVKKLTDWHQWKLETSLHLIRSEDLGLISVWSPTFILSLFQFFTEHQKEIEQALDAKNRRRFSAAMQEGFCQAELLWPKLRLLSCWNDGVSAQFSGALRKHFPAVTLQGKGLMATEGVVTFPLLQHTKTQDPGGTNASDGLQGGVIAVNSHFFEFMPIDKMSDRPLLVHELRPNELYSPIITTAGGLYRYHLKDVVKCCGYTGRVPILEFIGKHDRVSDVCGEKLNASLFDTYLQQAKNKLGIEASFAMAAPQLGTPATYTLFIETNASPQLLDALTKSVEACLCESHHYKYARDLGQLSPLRWHRVTNGWSTFQTILLNAGTRLGDIKPTSLDARFNWHEIFGA